MNIGKIEIDMSELDAATEKAERLSAMLDEIEARFDAIEARIERLGGCSIIPVASDPKTNPPPKPKR